MPGFKENAESLKEVVYETGTDGLDHLNCWKDTRVSESSPLLPERPMSTRKTFQPHFGNYQFGIGPPARIVCAQESGVAIVIGTAWNRQAVINGFIIPLTAGWISIQFSHENGERGSAASGWKSESSPFLKVPAAGIELNSW
jgi:hypothetical protein